MNYNASQIFSYYGCIKAENQSFLREYNRTQGQKAGDIGVRAELLSLTLVGDVKA